MKITEQEWVRITQALASDVAQYFKPKENMVIQDFIRTARESVVKVQKGS